MQQEKNKDLETGNNVTIENTNTNKKLTKQEICNGLARKFSNIKKLEIRGLKDDTLLFWQALNEIVISKNNNIAQHNNYGLLKKVH